MHKNNFEIKDEVEYKNLNDSFDDEINSDILLLEVGAEGGSLQLVLRANFDGIYTYHLVSSSSEHLLFHKEDLNNEKRLPNDESKPLVIDWFGAVKLLDDHRWPWYKLHPIYVHPSIKYAILNLLKSRYGNGDCINLSDWDYAIASNFTRKTY